MILRLLNWQGIAGDRRHAGICSHAHRPEDRNHPLEEAEREQYEQLYQQEQAAFATTVANARAAADQARAADQANADRVAAEQIAHQRKDRQ